MREEKFHIYLNDDEYSRVIQSLMRLLSYGADDSYAIYFLHLFEIQETPQSFYFCGKSEENGLYLVSEIRKSGDGLLREEALQPPV